ncbi:MAG: peptidase T [Dysgonamonadaceae bacterium]|jgi:tripeptide aminopeptidase|nr:peptidase T [Dysgonamonadaceae bacterium]
MTVTERFLKYVAFDTQSDENSTVTPSTAGQTIFAQALKTELEATGLSDVSLDENSYLMATLPANTDKKLPAIGFIAHLDTSPDMTGACIKPRTVKQYDGKNIILNEQQNIVLSPSMFPELLKYTGKDLIVTDGTTLLGADDKAGIAEIITAVETLISSPKTKHGKIRIAFTPDEEIGLGANKFDVKKFGCDFAYTIDGGEIGELEYENFNAAAAKITITGMNVHPGYAKGKIRNAMLIAVQFAKMLPQKETPEHTENYEGFFHLTGMKGTVETAELSYIIRDHDSEKFEQRLSLLKKITDRLNNQYPDSIHLEIRQQYRNMREIIEKQKHIVDRAEKAMRESGVTPLIRPVRGGTDGAHLSFHGLPCPNIFSGGINFHSRYEFIPIHSMEKAVEVILNIISIK